MAHIMSEPAFNILRTKEQLGYIVSCSRWTLSGDSQFGLRIIVQSERGTGYLEERVEAFLDTMDSKFEEMDIEEFNDFKRGLQHRWREPPKNLGEEASKYWQQIDSGFLDFLRRELPRACLSCLINDRTFATAFENADLLDNVEKHEVMALFRERVHPNAPKRSKLSIHMQSQKPRAPQVSAKAVEAFDGLIKEANPGIDVASIREVFNEANPIASDFVKHWTDTLSQIGDDAARDLLAKLPGLMEQYPVRDENIFSRTADVTRIKDIKTFKATLEVSCSPQPLVQWNDLPTSKL